MVVRFGRQVEVMNLEALEARNLLIVVDALCQTRSVTREEVFGRPRTKAVASARHEVWWRLRHDADKRLSYYEIARLFDRTHSSVLKGVRAYQRGFAMNDRGVGEEGRSPTLLSSTSTATRQ